MPDEPADGDPPFDLPPFEQPDAASSKPAAVPLSRRAMAPSPVAAPASASYLDRLNPEQRAAVEAVDGPVLILAGAGTGKTRVLIARVAHILATRRAWPSQILAVTFTNKAAREMKDRIATLTGETVEGMPWLGTFHSIGVKILRRHAELVDLKSGFTILDTDDQIRLMKQVIEAEGLEKDRWPARQLAGLIDGWKNQGLVPGKVPKGEGVAFGGGKGILLYAAYQKRLKELNACDFGDLLLEGLRLFQENPDVLAQYQERFKYILVDEYQDTNVVQYLWLRLLAQGSPNIACVGDDDQSIYGWRGADVDNILRFDQDFAGATVIRLERNYRSTGHILAAASGVIAHNKGRLGKTLFTDGEAGAKVSLLGVWDDEEEARAIGEDIEALKRRNSSLNEVAVLVRASFQMRAFEDRFMTMGLPYRVIGGPRFYERQEIKDAIAYLEVIANPVNDLKFERIINVPKRGLGDTTVQRLHTLARARSIPLYQAAREIIETDEVGAKARKTLAELVATFDRWRRQSEGLKHTEMAEIVLDESGYTAMWQADKSPQAQTRLENLKELVRFMHQFDTLSGFLEHVSLVMDVDQGDDGQRVSLMTLHAAKGLEFETVFLPGWEEGLFPHQRSLDESGLSGLEEERRLAYVGITRAKRMAKISFAQNRRNRGLYQSALPSRFIDELPEAHVDVQASRSPYGGGHQYGGSGFSGSQYSGSQYSGKSRFEERPQQAFQSAYDTPGWQRAQTHSAQAHSAKSSSSAQRAPAIPVAEASWGYQHQAGPNRTPLTIEGELVGAAPASGAGFAGGDRVMHQRFGFGTVAGVDGNKLTIDFDHSGRKRIIDSFVSRR